MLRFRQKATTYVMVCLTQNAIHLGGSILTRFTVILFYVEVLG